jgi:biotin carboxyl carrier protein
MKYIVTINNNNYEVDVDRGQATVAKAENAAPVAAEPKATAPAAAPTVAPAAVSTAEGQKLTAPMPGIVLGIKKNLGDRITNGDVVVILESMKMESEITSPFEGTLVQIVTSRGAHVNAGDVLLVIK